MKAEALVTQFENNSSEYIKIRKTVEEKVRATLSDGKVLLKFALDCLIESIKDNPEKYGSIIYENMPSMISYNVPSYSFYPYGQQQYRLNYYDAQAMLEHDAAKLYNELAKYLVDEILNEYTTSKSPQPTIPLLPSPDEEDFAPN
jgi:hypothetical protein